MVIYLHNLNDQPVTASTDLAILNADGTVKTSKALGVDLYASFNNKKDGEFSGWGPINWLERKDVMDPTNGFLQDDTLRVKVTVTMAKQSDDTTALTVRKSTC